MLVYPDITKPFVLETDASGGSSIGAVLSQSQDDGASHPVAYASRSLTRLESNYEIGDTGSGVGTYTFLWLPVSQCILIMQW